MFRKIDGRAATVDTLQVLPSIVDLLSFSKVVSELHTYLNITAFLSIYEAV